MKLVVVGPSRSGSTFVSHCLAESYNLKHIDEMEFDAYFLDVFLKIAKEAGDSWIAHAPGLFADMFKILEKISNNYLIINPHLNVYEKNHEHYELSQTFLDLKMFDYVNVIKNAKEVHLIDSSFSLLSKFVSPKKSKKFLYNKSGYKLSSGFFSGWEIIQS